MTQIAFAESQGPASPSQTSPFVSMMPLVVIFVIFYFLLIMPQQKKVKKHKKMIEDLKIGDKIITSSGFFAVVVGLGETTLEIKIAENVKIKILKSSVSEVIGTPQELIAEEVKK